MEWPKKVHFKCNLNFQSDSQKDFQHQFHNPYPVSTPLQHILHPQALLRESVPNSSITSVKQQTPKTAHARTCKAVGTKIWAHQNAQTYTRLQPPTSHQIHKEGVETVLLVILILGCRRIKPCCKVQVLNWQIPSQMEQEAAEIPICRAAATDCTSGSKILSLPADWNVIKSHFSMWEFKFSLLTDQNLKNMAQTKSILCKNVLQDVFALLNCSVPDKSSFPTLLSRSYKICSQHFIYQACSPT